MIVNEIGNVKNVDESVSLSFRARKGNYICYFFRVFSKFDVSVDSLEACFKMFLSFLKILC